MRRPPDGDRDAAMGAEMGVMERMAADAPLPDAHPWVRRLLARGMVAFDELITGAAVINPYWMCDADEALRQISAEIPEHHFYWSKLDAAALAWLKDRRGWSADRRADLGLTVYVGEIVVALRAVGRLGLSGCIGDFKADYWNWRRWASGLRLGSSHDPLAAVVAMTAAAQDKADGKRFLYHWHGLIDQATAADGWRDARLGLLALRHIPCDDPPPPEWLDGFVRWAKRLPDDDRAQEAFEKVWERESALFPGGPATWRKAAEPLFEDKALQKVPAFGWWKELLNWRAPAKKPSSQKAPELSPMPAEAHAVIKLLENPAQRAQGVAAGKALMDRHIGFAEKTGDAYYLVRACGELGKVAVRVAPDWAHELARTRLLWAPNDPFGWGLWVEALAAMGDPTTAELAAWEAVRRFPEFPAQRTTLGKLLVRQEGRSAEAEAVFRDAISRFPADVVARTALGNLLVDAKRLDEAEGLFNKVRELEPGDAAAEKGLAAVNKERGGLPKPQTGKDAPPPPSIGDGDLADEAAPLRAEGLSMRAVATLARFPAVEKLRQRSLDDIAAVLRDDPAHPLALLAQAGDDRDKTAKLGDAVNAWGVSLHVARRFADPGRFKALMNQAPEREAVVWLARRYSAAPDAGDAGRLQSFVNGDLRDGADPATATAHGWLRRVTQWTSRGVATDALDAALSKHAAEGDAVLQEAVMMTAAPWAAPVAAC
jgi:tetratricopeptide (TPR) repeat protein